MEGKSEMVSYEALYSNRLTQKEKKYKDGVIHVDTKTGAGRLIGEEGEHVLRLPSKPWETLLEREETFLHGGYILQILSRRSDISSGHAASIQDTPLKIIHRPQPLMPKRLSTNVSNHLLKKPLSSAPATSSNILRPQPYTAMNAVNNNTNVQRIRSSYTPMPMTYNKGRSASSILELMSSDQNIDDAFASISKPPPLSDPDFDYNPLPTSNMTNKTTSQVYEVSSSMCRQLGPSATSDLVPPPPPSIAGNHQSAYRAPRTSVIVNTPSPPSDLVPPPPPSIAGNHQSAYRAPRTSVIVNIPSPTSDLVPPRPTPSIGGNHQSAYRAPRTSVIVNTPSPLSNKPLPLHGSRPLRVSSLCFPVTPDSAKKLPMSFQSSFRDEVSYNSYLSSAIISEINVKLSSLSSSFVTVSCKVQDRNREQSLRNQHIAYYDHLSLILSRKQHKGGDDDGHYKRKRKKGKYNNMDSDNEEVESDGDMPHDKGNNRQETKYFLKIENGSNEASKKYSKGDLWFVSLSQNMSSPPGLFLVSQWHAPSSKNDLLEVKPFTSGTPIPASFTCGFHDSGSKRLFGIRCFNVSLEYVQYNIVNSDAVRFIPSLLPIILGKPDTVVASSSTAVNGELINLEESIIESFNLNEDQKKMLHKCLTWMSTHYKTGASITPSVTGGSITLCHGVFGGGKSFVMEACILFLSQAADIMKLPRSGPNSFRILLCTLTNVAVDRILLGLLKRRFTDFARVGSIKRIAKPLLKYTLHYSENEGKNNDAEAIALLKEMKLEELRNNGAATKSDGEDDHITAAIKDLEANIHRTQTLMQTRLTGVTCAACDFPILERNTFVVVMLDEVSQMVEPMSLVPIKKFQARHVIAVGDPQQLPPTLSDSQSVLKTTLFERLAQAGCDPIMLRTQYRLHPLIAQVANDLFYEGKLLNGVTEDSRSALLESFPPLITLDVGDGRENCIGGSFVNKKEADVISYVLRTIVHAGVPPSHIGVISLYKAQADLIYQMVASGPSQGVQVSTVDAFQGAERDIIILSTVRTTMTTSTSLSFISDSKRLNVAITRGKYHLILVGHCHSLSSERFYKYIMSKSRHFNSSHFSNGVTLSEFGKNLYAVTELEPESDNKSKDGVDALDTEDYESNKDFVPIGDGCDFLGEEEEEMDIVLSESSNECETQLVVTKDNNSQVVAAVEKVEEKESISIAAGVDSSDLFLSKDGNINHGDTTGDDVSLDISDTPVVGDEVPLVVNSPITIPVNCKTATMSNNKVQNDVVDGDSSSSEDILDRYDRIVHGMTRVKSPDTLLPDFRVTETKVMEAQAQQQQPGKKKRQFEIISSDSSDAED